jgi:hypothetical protein
VIEMYLNDYYESRSYKMNNAATSSLDMYCRIEGLKSVDMLASADRANEEPSKTNLRVGKGILNMLVAAFAGFMAGKS